MNLKLLYHYNLIKSHFNEGGTLVSSVSVTMEGSETATLPIEEPVTDTTPSPP